MSWDAVFGEIWFWIAAVILWLRAALSLYGAPRRLIGEARSGTFEGRRDGLGAAAFALDLVRWRRGAGHPVPPGLAPLRWPLLGAAAAWLLINAAFGDALSLALLTALGPVAATTLALEPRLQAATDAARGAEEREAKLTAFADTLEQAWRTRLAATAGAVLLTLFAATLGRFS